MPEVSVVIPTYNSAGYAAEAIRSVLAQTFGDLEVIVVDDGSTDDTETVIGSMGEPVRYLQQPNSGVSNARNRGIDESAGRYVAFLDADDIWLPDKLSKQIDALGSASGCRLCHTALMVSDSEMNPLEVRRTPPGPALELLLTRGNVIGSPSSVICERELFSETGGFDPGLSQCADWDMWIRLATRTEFLYVDEPLVKYRQHEMNMSRDPRLLEDDSVRMLEKAFDAPGMDPALAERRREAFGRNYMVLAGTYFQTGRYRDFARCAARSVSLDPRRAGYLAAYPIRAATRLPGRRGSTR